MSAPPSSDACTEHKVISENEHYVTFATYHPQWGGYVGCALVEIPRCVGGCFDVSNWHDGEFPRHDEPPMKLHYCDPMQVVDFGILVFEMQAKHTPDPKEQMESDEGRIEIEEIDQAIGRLQKLRAALTT